VLLHRALDGGEGMLGSRYNSAPCVAMRCSKPQGGVHKQRAVVFEWSIDLLYDRATEHT
jgi:hypothetical protein